MQRQVLKFDRFLIWTFRMNAGERKPFKPLEITRGLTTHGPFTLYPISVFVSGSFLGIRPGRDPLHYTSGMGGDINVDCDHLNGVALVAREDGSEYHCITPREHVPRFWKRTVFALSPGQSLTTLSGCYYYIAKGKLRGISDRLINIADTQLVAEQPTIITEMWTHE